MNRALTSRHRVWKSAIAILVLLFFLTISLLVSLLPKAPIAMLTLSVNASSEALQMVLHDKRTYSWSLPPGTISLISSKKNHCHKPIDDFTCEIDTPSIIQISGGPELKLESMPDGKFIFSLSPTQDRRMHIKILGKADEPILEADELLFFESQSDTTGVRIPMIAKSAIIGSMLYEKTENTGETHSTWQPMLLEGNYRIFANVSLDRNRFQLQEGDFNPGDVIFMQAESTQNKDSADDSVWGHISIMPSNNGAQGAAPILHVTLSTPFAKLKVRRFGAPAGYTITAPLWLVVSKLPAWQSTWVIFVSIVLVYGAFATSVGMKRRWDKWLLNLFFCGRKTNKRR